MKFDFKKRETPARPSEEFRGRLEQLNELIAIGKGDDREADQLREEMDEYYPSLTQNEIAYFETFSAAEDEKPKRTSASGGIDRLSRDVEIKGSIKFTRELLIDGKIEGDINSTGRLTIGENADVRGEIITQSVVIFGRLQGNITVEVCELKSHSTLQGDVKAARLVIEEGATFIGKSEVTSGGLVCPPTHVRHQDESTSSRKNVKVIA
jgi:cytoskeletal protein CcmA (bactofilin family)